ncbi:predicted protein [Naegleria gruberi]|uniref:Predicted protein n=1 Tax=Naegleria gruberi TaxID=5762 RepID=D2VAH6_NAEGR|nr:uncharacterized protein NAEGRDRAFT_65861 [Naegleria gruberi]EFC45958.1 predicted protein [Naegleria gruberi]|eukprot:XP_002678702.1 predicted protein [Naegleria gruberi strain NEG-M]
MLNHSPNNGGSNNSELTSSSKQKPEPININYLELFKNVKNFLYNEDIFKDSDENIIKQGCAQHYIKLERKGFSHFPDFILYSKSLKTELDVLILSHNEIRAIPPDIIQLEALKILDLSHNHHIKNFTYELMNLKNLIGLDLSYNIIERIPDAFFEKMKTKIMVLNLANNNIHSISNGNWADFAKKLIDLNLSDNKIVHIPDSLCECYNLTSLNLSANFIHHLPYDFYKLRKLKYLHLNRNRLSDLPMIEYENGDFSIFYDMELLENLDISHNSLSEEYLNGLGTLPNLKKYSFSHNNIVTLTQSFGISHSCKYLQTVHLSSNLLDELPTILADNLGNTLKELDICNNNISNLGDNFHKFVVLERLLMNRNFLTELPESIGSLVNLVELKASKNEIEKVSHLCFNENMKKLKEVDLDCNFIKELPSSIFLLPELITLRIEKNQLQSIPDTIVNSPNLYGIYAAYNELKELPENIGLCKCLRKIHVGKYSSFYYKYSLLKRV